MKLLLIGTLALLASLNAQARIGYTREECLDQYGPASKFSVGVDASDTFYIWRIGGIEVEAYLHDGKVVSMTYKKVKSPFETFTGEEIASLYAKNGGKPLALQLIDVLGDKVGLKYDLEYTAGEKAIGSVRIVTPELFAQEKAEEEARIAIKAKKETDERESNKSAFNSL